MSGVISLLFSSPRLKNLLFLCKSVVIFPFLRFFWTLELALMGRQIIDETTKWRLHCNLLLLQVRSQEIYISFPYSFSMAVRNYLWISKRTSKEGNEAKWDLDPTTRNLFLVRDCAIIIWRGGGSKISKVGLKIKLHPPPPPELKLK